MIGTEIGRSATPHADGHDRLTEGDDDDQPVALREVPGSGQAPPGGSAERRTDVVDQQCGNPQRGLRPPFEARGDEQQRCSAEHGGGESQHLLAQAAIVLRQDPEQHQVHQPKDQIADREHNRT